MSSPLSQETVEWPSMVFKQYPGYDVDVADVMLAVEVAVEDVGGCVVGSSVVGVSVVSSPSQSGNSSLQMQENPTPSSSLTQFEVV